MYREAHAVDEWPLGSSVVVPQHQTIEERIAAARKFQDEFDVRVSLCKRHGSGKAVVCTKHPPYIRRWFIMWRAMCQAMLMCSQYQIPILVDDIDDSFNKCFSAWPERYFIVHNGVMEPDCPPPARM